MGVPILRIGVLPIAVDRTVQRHLPGHLLLRLDHRPMRAMPAPLPHLHIPYCLPDLLAELSLQLSLPGWP